MNVTYLNKEVFSMTVDALQKTINELYLNQNPDIDRWAEQYMKVYIDAYMNHAISKFSEESLVFSNQLEALREYFAIDDNLEHKRIYCFAMIDTIKNLGDRIAELDSGEVGEYSNFKYIYPILEVLYNNGMVSVGNMAKNLKVERHTLTNAIRRADKFELWIRKKQGRYSLYQITSKGERAYIAYVKKKVLNDRKSLDGLFNTLLKEIEDHMVISQPDVNEIVRKINRQLGCSGFSSTMMKISIQNVFKKRNEYVKKINNIKKDFYKSNIDIYTDTMKEEYISDGNDFRGEDMYKYGKQIKHRSKFNPFSRKEVGEIG